MRFFFLFQRNSPLDETIEKLEAHIINAASDWNLKRMINLDKEVVFLPIDTECKVGDRKTDKQVKASDIKKEIFTMDW